MTRLHRHPRPPPLSDLLREVVDQMVISTRAERGFLITLDEEDRPKVHLARNSNREEVLEKDKQVSQKLIGKVLRSRKGLRMRNARSEAE